MKVQWFFKVRSKTD